MDTRFTICSKVRKKGSLFVKQVKFIHAADLHLDSPFKGMEMNVPQSVWERMKQSTFESFERIIDKAIQERVDFVLLADLYDAETKFEGASVCARANEEAFAVRYPCFIIHGNHDHLGEAGQQLSFRKMFMCLQSLT